MSEFNVVRQFGMMLSRYLCVYKMNSVSNQCHSYLVQVLVMILSQIVRAGY